MGANNGCLFTDDVRILIYNLHVSIRHLHTRKAPTSPVRRTYYTAAHLTQTLHLNNAKAVMYVQKKHTVIVKVHRPTSRAHFRRQLKFLLGRADLSRAIENAFTDQSRTRRCDFARPAIRRDKCTL